MASNGNEIGGTVVFTGARSRQGYRLNKLASSLTNPENRKAFLGDEDAYMDRFKLNDSEKSLVAARNWQGLLEAGGNNYLLLKIAATVGSNLLEMGAAMWGETLSAFMATRRGPRSTEGNG